MTSTLQLSSRGTITLPKRFREKFGLKAESVVVLEDTEQGILVRPASVFPFESYSEERLGAFEAENNTAIAGAFPVREE